MVSAFFDLPPGCLILPVSSILPRQAPDPARVKKALAKMSAAARGLGPKRPPLTVAAMEDGRYLLLDGNSTLHALLILGEQDAAVAVSRS